ncbi:fatty acid desaturase [bacterium]|nr:MAG: fatty acid desaturase [bacterium]
MEKKDDHSLAVPYKLNVTLAAGHVLINLYQFFILPLYFLPRSPWWALTLAPVAALNNPFWSLIHEAIHDMFHPSSRINAAAGRVLSVFFGSPFRVLRFSHLMHHKFNRTPLEGTELYDPERSSRFRAAPGYYFQILGGLYLLEFVSPLPFFLPLNRLRAWVQRSFKSDTLRGILFKSLMSDEAIREMRTDGLAVFALFGLSAFCYGEYWGLLVAALAVRAFLISFLDNVYHYRTPVNDIFYAGNLRLSRPLSTMLLHFNLHGIHHRNPAIPWSILPQVFGAERRKFDGNYFTAAARQLWGPVPLSELPHWRPAMDRRISGSF